MQNAFYFPDSKFKNQKLVQILLAYLLTSGAFLLLIPLLYFMHSFTITRTLILLFILDSVQTIEAADVGDIVAISLLHVFMVPALLILLYLDVVQHHKNQFKCFLCGEEIAHDQEIKSVQRTVLGKSTDANVHAICISPSQRSASISERTFRRGIPE